VTARLALELGAAVVDVLGPRIAVAWDTRPSGPMLAHAVTAGVAAAGGEAVLLGVLPTPGVSALVPSLGLSAGVMVTASHNPAEDNGLKVVTANGEKLEGEALRAVQSALAAGLAGGARQGEPGAVRVVADAGDRYVAAVLAALPRGRWLAGRTIVLDTANGAASGLAGRVLVALGARLISLADGDGPINHRCGALHPERAVDAVRSAGADAGICLDGDGDRGHVVTPDGEVLDGDAMLWLCAASIDTPIVGTVMSNGGLEASLARIGRRLVRTPVGDAHVAAGMREFAAALGGEPSGHVLFADGLPTADGLLTALRAIHPDPATIRSRLAGLTRFALASRAVRVPASRIPATVPVQAALEAAGARVIVRPSGTEPVVRLTVEHADPGVVREGLDSLAAALESS
jgi:phosphoglucosamine mutase